MLVLVLWLKHLMIRKLFTFYLISFCINANADIRYICKDTTNLSCVNEKNADWYCYKTDAPSQTIVKGIAQCRKDCKDNYSDACNPKSGSIYSNCHCLIVWPIVSEYTFVQDYETEPECKRSCAQDCIIYKSKYALKYLYNQQAAPNFEEP